MNTLANTQNHAVDSRHSAPIAAIIKTYKKQASALLEMAEQVDAEQYSRAIDLMFNGQGHVIMCGMGKSGHVGKKIAATLASTGTPSFFLHPSEAFHGDLGMITKDDVIILISNSGETDEVLQLIPSLKCFGVKIISMTGRSDSTLAKHSDVILLLAQAKESCPNNLAPTTSTTSTIVMGDALAVALMNMRGFKANDFARFHPGGALGRRLLTKASDVMTKDKLPLVQPTDSMANIILAMNSGRLGVAIVIQQDELKGIITDGDLRRAMADESVFHTLTAQELMTSAPKTCHENDMLADIEEKMRQNNISSLVVLNDADKVSGLVQLLAL